MEKEFPPTTVEREELGESQNKSTCQKYESSGMAPSIAFWSLIFISLQVDKWEPYVEDLDAMSTDATSYEVNDADPSWEAHRGWQLLERQQVRLRCPSGPLQAVRRRAPSGNSPFDYPVPRNERRHPCPLQRRHQRKVGPQVITSHTLTRFGIRCLLAMDSEFAFQSDGT